CPGEDKVNAEIATVLQYIAGNVFIAARDKGALDYVLTLASCFHAQVERHAVAAGLRVLAIDHRYFDAAIVDMDAIGRADVDKSTWRASARVALPASSATLNRRTSW